MRQLVLWGATLLMSLGAAQAYAQQETYTYRSGEIDQFYTPSPPNPYRGGKHVVLTVTVSAPLPTNTLLAFTQFSGTVTYTDGVHSYTAPTGDPYFYSSWIKTGLGGRIVKSSLYIGPAGGWDESVYPRCERLGNVFGVRSRIICDHLGGNDGQQPTPDEAESIVAGKWRVDPPLVKPAASSAAISTGLK